jgi:hypothetical protein
LARQDSPKVSTVRNTRTRKPKYFSDDNLDF